MFLDSVPYKKRIRKEIGQYSINIGIASLWFGGVDFFKTRILFDLFKNKIVYNVYIYLVFQTNEWLGTLVCKELLGFLNM